MIEITILYPFAPGRRFDHDYYLTKHIPMALERLGPAVLEVTVTKGLTPGPPWPGPTYAAICRFLCESLEAYEQAVLPHLADLQGDLVNYSDCEPVIQIGELAAHAVVAAP